MIFAYLHKPILVEYSYIKYSFFIPISLASDYTDRLSLGSISGPIAATAVVLGLSLVA